MHTHTHARMHTHTHTPKQNGNRTGAVLTGAKLQEMKTFPSLLQVKDAAESSARKTRKLEMGERRNTSPHLEHVVQQQKRHGSSKEQM